MVMSPTLLGIKNDCAGEAQQQFIRNWKILIIDGKAIAEIIFSVYSKAHFINFYVIYFLTLYALYRKDKRALPGNLQSREIFRSSECSVFDCFPPISSFLVLSGCFHTYFYFLFIYLFIIFLLFI
jgi:hypothetical protein